MIKLAVIGTGYVGLVTAAGFAEAGHDVVCVDRDRARIEALTRGELPFHEPGLPALLARNVEVGRLRFATDAETDLAVIAVGTPSLADGSADVSQVFAAAHAARARVIVLKSTVPVGTAAALRAELGVSVVSNPEFLREGSAVQDLHRPARIVVGCDDHPASIELMRALYRHALSSGVPMHVMSTRSAELTKYAANAMLAVRISFMNELAALADHIGADIDAVRQGIGSDPRIGPSFLAAGAGFGGSCLPKDLRALLHLAQTHDVPLASVEAAARTNERQKHALFERLARRVPLAGARIAVWGLAFKPNTDDLRESMALPLLDQLARAGATAVAYDPVAMPAARRLLGDRLELADDAYAAARDADALVLVTEWDALRTPDFARLATVMRGRLLVDGRNAWSSAAARALGFTYEGIGRR